MEFAIKAVPFYLLREPAAQGKAVSVRGYWRTDAQNYPFSPT